MQNLIKTEKEVEIMIINVFILPSKIGPLMHQFQKKPTVARYSFVNVSVLNFVHMERNLLQIPAKFT